MFELFELGLCNKFFYDSTTAVVICFFLVFVGGYLLGSLNFGVILSKAFYGGDVRSHGSGNAGATNMLRTYGKLPAALTFLGDAAKTALAVLFGALLLGVHTNAFYIKDGVIYKSFEDMVLALSKLYGTDGPDVVTGVGEYAGFAGMYIGGMAAIIGHAFPVYYKFKGGKSVIATLVLVLFTEPLVALICLMFFVAIVAATKYISLGSVMSVIVYPLILYRMTGPGPHDLVAIFVMLFVVYLHRANIQKLLNGTENKLSFKKKEQTDKNKKKGKDS
ncbi:MAG: glycerol-3-phosphate 1-O-acyltransferase PlsY [Oscillospiraceae bacterium]|nr:glycerol-3-phosphate 1-O-acyltransferase PlsY [Oscillospiraceae bacterium]